MLLALRREEGSASQRMQLLKLEKAKKHSLLVLLEGAWPYQYLNFRPVTDVRSDLSNYKNKCAVLKHCECFCLTKIHVKFYPSR